MADPYTAQDTQQDDTALAAWINGCLSEAKKHSAVWRKNARDWYDFYASKQWDPETEAQMQDQRKVPIVFNRTARTINAVIGLEIQNRQAVQFIPRGVEDTKVSELYTAAADWIRDNCDAEDEESEAFQDMLITGMGGTETRLEYDEEPDGTPVIERIDPLELFWDATAIKKNMRDRRWCARVKRATDSEIKEKWPEFIEPESATETYLSDDERPHDATPPFYDKEQPEANRPKTRELVCFQWFERVSYYRVQQSNGQIVEFDEEKWSRIGPVVEKMGLQWVKQQRKHYMKAYLVSGVLLETMDLEAQTGFTLNFITGARDRNANTWFGLVALMMDPQRWANKWLSQIIHILNSSAKGGLIAEKDAFANPKVAEDTWARSETITWTNPGAVAGGKVMPKPQTPMPEGFSKLLDFAVNSINDVPGVNMELMGLVGTNQPGVLESMRKQAGMTILAVFFDAMRLYRKDQGRIMVAIIRDHISDGRLIRVVGKDGAQYVPLVRDPRALTFDIVVDESPTSPNNKERVFGMMTQLAPVLEKAGVPLPPDILDYSPLPSALVDKWKDYIEQNKQVPPELQAKFAQMMQATQVLQGQVQKLSEENFALKTDASIEIYKIREQSKVDRDVQRSKESIEAEKRGVEVYKANLDAMLERLGLVADTMAANMKAASEAHIPRTEQAVGRLGDSLAPLLQKMMDISISQTERIDNLGPALQGLGEQIVQGINKAFADNRLVSSEPVYDAGTSRLRAIKRTFGNGDMDELPYRRETVQ